MPHVVAFLRAINVGGHTVKMDALRAMFEALGLARVETFIASGNVIFEAALSSAKMSQLEKKIEAHLERELGYEVATFLRDAAVLGNVARHPAFDEAALVNANRYVAFMKRPATADAAAKLGALNDDFNAFRLNGRELYWLRRRAQVQSEYSGATIERALGQPMTMRNMNTVERLFAKYPT